MTVVKELTGRSSAYDAPAGASPREIPVELDAILDDLAAPVRGSLDERIETIIGALNGLCARLETLADEARSVGLLVARLGEGRERAIGLPRLMANPVFRSGASNVSKREKEILSHLLRGKSNREISQELSISEKTVKNHLWKLYRKLGVRNRTQLFHHLIST
ncbi:MAG: helix-turn-helix transcriptional regulator [Candidatus Krumholzibacteria bacterium]|nr:helix-turn-helix transcriptional regulator [Candidatus Krumholzibacteria bacterium]